MKKIITVPQRSYNNPQLQEMQKLMLFILLMSTKKKNLSKGYDLSPSPLTALILLILSEQGLICSLMKVHPKIPP